jgi:hypothetical protein
MGTHSAFVVKSLGRSKALTVAQQNSLKNQILDIIAASSEPLSLPTIELKLKQANDSDADTFDVRDAVAELVQKQQAVFVPGRLVWKAAK